MRIVWVLGICVRILNFYGGGTAIENEADVVAGRSHGRRLNLRPL